MENENNILSNSVRVGVVSSTDAGYKARVLFPDTGIVSGWLCVLQHPKELVEVKPKGGHTHETPSGTASEAGEHFHEASTAGWMPEVNDTVLVLYLPVFNSDGFVLGVIK